AGSTPTPSDARSRGTDAQSGRTPLRGLPSQARRDSGHQARVELDGVVDRRRAPRRPRGPGYLLPLLPPDEGRGASTSPEAPLRERAAEDETSTCSSPLQAE